MRRAGSPIPSQFDDIIVKVGSDGRITRLKDVGRVELGAADYSSTNTLRRAPRGRASRFPAARHQCDQALPM